MASRLPTTWPSVLVKAAVGPKSIRIMHMNPRESVEQTTLSVRSQYLVSISKQCDTVEANAPQWRDNSLELE